MARSLVGTAIANGAAELEEFRLAGQIASQAEVQKPAGKSIVILDRFRQSGTIT